MWWRSSLVLVVVEAACFDRGCGGCQLDIFVMVVVGEEKEREKYFFISILLDSSYYFIGLYVK